MIGFFPHPYEDELFYSLLSRYYLRSGYLSYASVAEDLFLSPRNRPNIELCSPLSENAKQHIGVIEEIIQKHTLFNYYKAFITPQKQLTAWNYAISMNIKELVNILPIPKSRYVRYLRYCPICVNEDRDEYKETYWHCGHQIYGISVCHKHGCKLIDSTIQITSNSSPTLITAEESIGESIDNIILGNDIEIKLAKYAFEILSSSTFAHSPIGVFLHHKLQGTRYLSPRGAARNIGILSKDFKDFFAEVDLLGFGEEWQIEKIFNDKRFNPFENCLLGMFLNIPPNDLVDRNIDSSFDIVTAFDRNIKKMRAQGITYKQISEVSGISYDYCKAIVNGKPKSPVPRSLPKVRGKVIDWDELDKSMLPKVKQLICDMTSINDVRPQKVTMYKVQRLLNLRDGQLKNLPQCMRYIKSNIISQEEFWGLELAWAMRQLEEGEKPISITNLRRLTNMRNRYVKEATPYLDKYLNESQKILITRLFAQEDSMF